MLWSLRSHDINRISTFLHLGVFLVTCTAMAQSGWFRVRGLHCAPHVGLTAFFGLGNYNIQIVPPGLVLHQENGDIDLEMKFPVTVSYLFSQLENSTCISPRVLSMLRMILLLCFMVLIFSLLGIIVNITNLRNENVKIIQKYGIMSIFCVIWVITIVIECYNTSVVFEDERNIPGIYKTVEVYYEYGFYIITAAGFVAILGVATNLLNTTVTERAILRRNLVEEWEDFEGLDIRASPRRRSITRPSPRPGAFVPTPQQSGRSSQNSCNNRMERVPVEILVERDQNGLPPPPPYTP